jgi:putative tryptophan/tyrosine transport system substrate-binding protein
MRRRVFLGLVLLSLPRAILAQESRRVRRIGFLLATTSSNYPQLYDALRGGLREQGYVEGHNIDVLVRGAEGHADRLPGLVAELAAQNVELIVTSTTPAAQAATAGAPNIPVVFVGVGDPVGAQLVRSLARPGGNVTGLTLLTPELTGKRIELLKEAKVDIARVAVLWNPGIERQVREIQDLESAAPKIGVQLLPVAVTRADELEPAHRFMADRNVDALMVLASGFHHQHLGDIAKFAARHRIATICEFSEFVTVGGMMVYGPSYPEMLRRAGSYAAKILNGAKPSELPVEQPTKFELVVNLKVARALGIEIPAVLLARADEIIE